ncbi:MAG: multiprotein-bridging factor 1 family protein [Hyphomicrobiales bacterium]
MITAEQCRGARGMLDWSQARLAKEAGVSLSTVRDFEKGRHLPQPRNMLTLVEVMEAAGITFTRGGDNIGLVFKT